jgi:hypothetical protein
MTADPHRTYDFGESCTFRRPCKVEAVNPPMFNGLGAGSKNLLIN